MYSVTRLLDVADGNRDRILRAVRASADNTEAQYRIVEPTLPGARNGGDILVHLRFDAEDQWRSVETDFEAALADAAITRVNGACYSGDLFRNRSATGTVYRTLLLRVLPGTDPDTVARFEEELALMPRYVNTITAWQLSRVEEAGRNVGVDPCIRAGVHRRRRADGPLPDAPYPLGGGGPLVRPRDNRCDRQRSCLPQLLCTRVADPVLAIPASRRKVPRHAAENGKFASARATVTARRAGCSDWPSSAAPAAAGPTSRRGCAPASAATTDSAG